MYIVHTYNGQARVPPSSLPSSDTSVAAQAAARRYSTTQTLPRRRRGSTTYSPGVGEAKFPTVWSLSLTRQGFPDVSVDSSSLISRRKVTVAASDREVG